MKKKELLEIESEIALLGSVEDKLKEQKDMLGQMTSSKQEYGLSCYHIHACMVHSNIV